MNELDEIQRPPRRLPPGTNRKLLRSALLAVLLGGIWFVVGGIVVSVLLAIGNPLHDHQLDGEAAVADGTVTELRIDHSTRVNNRHPWRVRYKFRANDEDWEGKASTMDENLVRGLEEGSPIKVEYLPSKPSVSRVKGMRASVFPAALFLVPAFFLVGGGLVFASGWAKVLRMRGLLVNGQVALGKADRVAQRGTRQPVDVFYTFQDSRGTDWSARTRSYSPKTVPRIEVGQELKIVYDYGNPRRSLAYELLGIDLSGRP